MYSQICTKLSSLILSPRLGFTLRLCKPFMSTPPSPVVSTRKLDVIHSEIKDVALQSIPPPPELSAVHQRRIWRKIDIRLLPILTLMYLCAYLDRGKRISHED